MALPTASEVLSLDYIGWSLPKANADVSASVNTFSLDIVGWSLPQICQPSSTSAPAEAANKIWVKTGNTTWVEVSVVKLKTANTTWTTISKFHVKTASGWND